MNGWINEWYLFTETLSNSNIALFTVQFQSFPKTPLSSILLLSGIKIIFFNSNESYANVARTCGWTSQEFLNSDAKIVPSRRKGQGQGQ